MHLFGTVHSIEGRGYEAEISVSRLQTKRPDYRYLRHDFRPGESVGLIFRVPLGRAKNYRVGRTVKVNIEPA